MLSAKLACLPHKPTKIEIRDERKPKKRKSIFKRMPKFKKIREVCNYSVYIMRYFKREQINGLILSPSPTRISSSVLAEVL